MNKKQKNILGITSIIFVPTIIVLPVMSIVLGSYDFFCEKMLDELRLFSLAVPIVGFLLYFFRDKKNKLDDKTLQALEEAIDALGDIPADQLTRQQKLAYKLCIQVMVDNGYLENYTIPDDWVVELNVSPCS